ncbi:hypothetical protein B9Z55_004550 [Caenorhabditis nigoni]|nr:hypothetical protein B9Z55_004550 [Caenorhabditis nigoni]
MSDFKMELLLQNQKYNVRAIHFELGNINPGIHINTTNECPSVSFEETENNNGIQLTKLVQLRNRYQKENEEELCLTHVSLEEMFRIYSNLTLLFSSPGINWILLFSELELDAFWEYTERILKTEFNGFTVCGEIALKFRSFEYKDARWLKIEDLFNIRNSYSVELGTTNFDCSDVNQFLHYWSDCDKDMMEQININLREGTQIDMQEILKNFITISDSYRCFIKARNMRHRKYIVGELEFIENEIRFSAWDPFKEDRLYQYLVLKLVYQKRDCEKKIRENEKKCRGLPSADKTKFQLELEELERKLTVLNRDFVV